MTDLQTRILEIEADHDAGRLARALEAVIVYCDEIIEDAIKYGMADMHLAGQGAQARAIRKIIEKTLGADDD